MRILDIFADFPGRSHDAYVFRNNPVYQTLPDRLRGPNMPPLIETYHIVGDSAFPLSPQVMTPFKRHGQDLNRVQWKFNRNLSSKRNVRSSILTLTRTSLFLKNVINICFTMTLHIM